MKAGSDALLRTVSLIIADSVFNTSVVLIFSNDSKGKDMSKQGAFDFYNIKRVKASPNFSFTV